MTEFEKYILKNHPDPDGLVGNLGVYTQMVRLAEDYAKSKVENLGLDNVIVPFVCGKCGGVSDRDDWCKKCYDEYYNEE